MRPNFTNIDFKSFAPATDFGAWEKEVGNAKNWITTEQIGVKPVYGKADLEGHPSKHDISSRHISEALDVPVNI